MSAIPTDKELIEADTDTAFRTLYERYWQPMLANAVQRLGDSSEAEDAVQEVFISFWRNRKQVDIENDASAYLFGALKFCIIKQINRKAKKGFAAPLDIADLANPAYSDELIRMKELEKVIDEAAQTLPPRMQEIYMLSRREYLSIQDIAARLQLSNQTVKNNLVEGLKRLRAKLAEEGFFFAIL